MTARYDLPEHPFAPFIRILGRGKKGMRDLTFDQAETAMTMILSGRIEAEQLGAFLMLMRVKEETAEELAGFISAARSVLPNWSQSSAVDLDWPSYAGKRRHLPWFLLSALLLAENGIKILMHGAAGHTGNRLYVEQLLPLLGLKAAESMTEAEQQIHSNNFSYLPLSRFCPRLHEMIELRSILGLRSPIHSLARTLNPGRAPATLLGIFHLNYREIHQQAALILPGERLAVFRGEGGEGERNPDADSVVYTVTNNQANIETWPRLFSQRHQPPETLTPDQLLAFWQGQHQDDYARASVIGTCALALSVIGRTTRQSQAMELAESFWNQHLQTIKS